MIAKMNETGKEEQYKADAERQRVRRASMSDAKKTQERKKAAERARKSQASMTQDQKREESKKKWGERNNVVVCKRLMKL